MIVAAAVDHRGFIKVDEVDGRSPVERAAATFVPDPRRHLCQWNNEVRRKGTAKLAKAKVALLKCADWIL